MDTAQKVGLQADYVVARAMVDMFRGFGCIFDPRKLRTQVLITLIHSQVCDHGYRMHCESTRQQCSYKIDTCTCIQLILMYT